MPFETLCITECLKALSLRESFKQANNELWAVTPNAIITCRLDIDFISEFKKVLQDLISEPIGLFFGGTHLTALVIRQSISFKLSSFDWAYEPFANPYLIKVEYNTSPA